MMKCIHTGYTWDFNDYCANPDNITNDDLEGIHKSLRAGYPNLYHE